MLLEFKIVFLASVNKTQDSVSLAERQNHSKMYILMK